MNNTPPEGFFQIPTHPSFYFNPENDQIWNSNIFDYTSPISRNRVSMDGELITLTQIRKLMIDHPPPNFFKIPIERVKIPQYINKETKEIWSYKGIRKSNDNGIIYIESFPYVVDKLYAMTFGIQFPEGYVPIPNFKKYYIHPTEKKIWSSISRDFLKTQIDVGGYEYVNLAASLSTQNIKQFIGYLP